jgi:hypothetical protein
MVSTYWLDCEDLTSWCLHRFLLPSGDGESSYKNSLSMKNATKEVMYTAYAYNG